MCFVNLQIVQGSPDLLEKVVFDLGGSFQPSKFICTCPIPIRRPNGRTVYRFATRQQVYGNFSASVKLLGTGGSAKTVPYETELSQRANTVKHQPMVFSEHRPILPIRMVKVPVQQNFGIELELTSPTHISTPEIASLIPFPCDIVDSWGEGRASSRNWKIVPDSSIMCSPNEPACHKFELVSPILTGGDGLAQVSNIMNALPSDLIQVNKSMGFHVHIDVSGLSTRQLIKVCQNFCKYEHVMDSFMPPSRRTGSMEANRYFQSNRESVAGVGATNREVHNVLGSCTDLYTLINVMNRQGRYYKLNLQNLKTGRQPTIEFRQHSATANYEKISAWVRFCIWLVQNSAKLSPPKPFAKGRSLDTQFQALFHYVIKDRALRDFYMARRKEFVSSHEGTDDCCDACAYGGTCVAIR